jgi:hypothetical protein
MSAVAEQKGQPFSVRFTKRIDKFMELEAKRLKRSKSSLVEELATEAATSRRFPGIGYRGEGQYREPWILGSGLDVWELCWMIEDYEGDIARLVEDHLPVEERHCRLALAYRREHPEEIEEAIAENRRTPEEWLALYPFVEYVGPPT